MNFFKKTTKVLSGYFRDNDLTNKETKLSIVNDSLISLTNNVILWKINNTKDKKSVCKWFENEYKSKYLIFNMNEEDYLSNATTKYVSFKLLNNSNFTLFCIISIAIQASNWLKSDPLNILIICSDFTMVFIYMSYTKVEYIKFDFVYHIIYR